MLGFRRATPLSVEPVVLLFAMRTSIERRLGPAGLPGACGTVRGARRAGRDGAARRARRPIGSGAPSAGKITEAAGDPLALRELPHAAAATPTLSPAAPAPAHRAARAGVGRAGWSDLPAATQTLLLVAALNRGGGVGSWLAATSLLTGEVQQGR